METENTSLSGNVGIRVFVVTREAPISANRNLIEHDRILDSGEANGIAIIFSVTPKT